MFPTWSILAIASTVIAALVNVLDSHFLARRLPSLRSYLLVVNVFFVLIGFIFLALFPLPVGLGFRPVVSVLISAASRVASLVLMLGVLRKEEVVRVVPIASTVPIFVAILAVAFLGEYLTWMHWLAIFAVAGGVVLLSFKQGADGAVRFNLRPLIILLSASLLFAVGDITSKYALSYMSFWNSVAITAVFGSSLILIFCLRRSVFRELASVPHSRRLTAVIALVQILALGGIILGAWATQSGPVSLVAAIFSIKPLFVFFFAVVISQRLPGFIIMIDTSLREIATKVTATLVIVGGITAIVLI